MGARNQVGLGLSYRSASLCSLATQFQTRFLESILRPIAGLNFSTLIGASWFLTIRQLGSGSPISVISWIRICIKVISWIQIPMNLKMKSQNVCNTSLFEHFFKVLSLYFEARIRIRIRIEVKGRIRIRISIKVTSRIRIRIKVKGRIRIRVKVMLINNTGSHKCTPTLDWTG
jgi:hypothetical protein